MMIWMIDVDMDGFIGLSGLAEFTRQAHRFKIPMILETHSLIYIIQNIKNEKKNRKKNPLPPQSNP